MFLRPHPSAKVNFSVSVKDFIRKLKTKKIGHRIFFIEINLFHDFYFVFILRPVELRRLFDRIRRLSIASNSSRMCVLNNSRISLLHIYIEQTSKLP